MSSRGEREDAAAFEDEVRRTAEAVWDLSPGECQPEHYTGGTTLHELDGIVELRDVTHLIMATVSRRLDKVKEDVKKLRIAERKSQRPGVPVQMWFIARDQLSAEHVRHCKENSVTALTLAAFKARFFDGRSYIAKRRVAPFGSARNLGDGSVTFPDNEYVPLPLRVIAERGEHAKGPRAIDFDHLLTWLREGRTVVLVGPFGAGKSLTTREVFLKLADRFLKDANEPVPAAVNLRDHWGAKYADEVLERHAREIGFRPIEDIVVAWRAGLTVLLLDGFDEMAAQVVARASDRNFMRDARMQSLAAVRELLSTVPAGPGLLLTGREHYFDSHEELAHACGIAQRNYCVVELGEFGEAEAAKYLRAKGINASLPGWLPRKPLILGYLASRDLLEQVLAIDGSRGWGFAWAQFLDRICQREAAHGRSVMDAGTLRSVLERLAFEVRATVSGTGPITERDLAEAYFAATGQNAGEGVLMQLQRLPGLTPRGPEPSSRSFIDEDLLAALQGSALARFILEAAHNWNSRRVVTPLSGRAATMAAHLLATSGASAAVAVAAARRVVAQDLDARVDRQLAADCLEVAILLAEDVGKLDCQGIRVSDVHFRILPLEGIRIDNLVVEESIIDEVIIDEVGAGSSMSLKGCVIPRVLGASSADALPKTMFQACTYEEFDDLRTNAAVVRSDKLKPRLKALITILRKVYLQAGGGRRRAALDRGIPPGPIAEAIQPVLDLLITDGLVTVERGIVHPVRSCTARARAIVTSANLSKDVLLQRVEEI